MAQLSTLSQTFRTAILNVTVVEIHVDHEQVWRYVAVLNSKQCDCPRMYSAPINESSVFPHATHY